MWVWEIWLIECMCFFVNNSSACFVVMRTTCLWVCVCVCFIIVSRCENKKAVSTTVKMSVVNIHLVNGEHLQFDVYVGCTYKDLADTKWANPFSKFWYSEEDCITNFKEYFFTNPHLFLNNKQLKNKVLVQ